MIQITPPQNPQYWINQRALTFSENDLENVNRIAVSLVSGTVIMVYEKGVIDYAPDGNFQKWTLKGYSTRLVSNLAHHIYARLSRTEKDALIVFSINNYNIDGSITTIVTDASGNPVLDEDGKEQTTTSEPNPNYWYVKIGEITATNGTSNRELTYDSGALGTSKGVEESAGWNEMFELSKQSTPWLIFVKQMFYEFTVKNPITLLSGLIFKNNKGVEKKVTDVKRSTDSDEDVPISDESIPTTKYITELSEKKYLRKDVDDRSAGTISSDKGFQAGEFTPDATGAACYADKDGNWHIETDFLKVRKKATFTDVEIQEVHHVGGQMLLTAADMRVSYVYEMTDRYRCYFPKVDSDGREVYNMWIPGDQAYCNTFNLSKQADGTLGNHYLWRLVVDTNLTTKDDAETRTFGDTTIQTSEYNFTDLSKSECGDGSDVPKAMDELVHLGYQGEDDPERQNAILIAGAGKHSPYIYEFVGISSFKLPEPETQLKPGDNVLSGRVHITKGSTGAENLTDLPDEIFKAAQIGSVNLLLNSGFTGDYQSEEINDKSALLPDEQLYSRQIKHWEGEADVNTDAESISGFSVEIGSLEQPVLLIDKEQYVVSFKAKGKTLDVWLGNTIQQVTLTSTYQRYALKYSFISTPIGVHRFKIEGDATVCDLMLERGTIPTDWHQSPLDNDKSFAEFQSLYYLSDALKNGSTDILNGLLLTNVIMLGNYLNGKMQKVTSGVSGIYNNGDDVAFWGGGTFEQAIQTVVKFKNNPRYKPADEEWANMANFVVTHGGDAFLRGYIYALGGFFRGTVEIANGKILLNEDGSGHFANQAVRWTKEGIMYRRSSEIIEWISIESFTSHFVNYDYGTYFDVSLPWGSTDLDYQLKVPEKNGFSIVLYYSRWMIRQSDSAILSGNFRVNVFNEDTQSYEIAECSSLQCSRENRMYTLVWSTTYSCWIVNDGNASINEGVAVLGSQNTVIVGGESSEESGTPSRVVITENKVVAKAFETPTKTFTVDENGSVTSAGNVLHKMGTKSVLLNKNTQTIALLDDSGKSVLDFGYGLSFAEPVSWGKITLNHYAADGESLSKSVIITPDDITVIDWVTNKETVITPSKVTTSEISTDTINAKNITATGGITTNRINSSGAIVSTGVIQTSKDISGGTLTASSTSDSSIATEGGISASKGVSCKSVNASGAISGKSISAESIAATGTISGASVNASGGVSAASYKVGSTEGLSDNITINAADGVHVLTFTSGLLAAHSFTANSTEQS